jgi:Ribonuclease G/E
VQRFLWQLLRESVEKTCPACEGRGTTPTVPSLALSILRQLEDGSLQLDRPIENLKGDLKVRVIAGSFEHLFYVKRSNA